MNVRTLASLPDPTLTEDGNETIRTYIRTTYGGVRLGCHVITLTNGMDLLITAAVLLQ